MIIASGKVLFIHKGVPSDLISLRKEYKSFDLVEYDPISNTTYYDMNWEDAEKKVSTKKEKKHASRTSFNK